MIGRKALAVALFAAFAGPTFAGEIEDLARDAETKLRAGQHLAAVEALRRAIGIVNAKSPLALRKVQFIAEPPKGFGIYKQRANSVFRPGEPLIVYAEPVGMGWRLEDGLNNALLATDFEIRTPDGQVLGGQKEFGRFSFASHEQNQEIMTHLTIRLSGIPAGAYVFGATYRDEVGRKSASLELPFQIK